MIDRPRVLGIDPNRNYSQTQLAKLLGKSYKTVRRWRIKGLSPGGVHIRPDFVCVGNTWLIQGSDAAQFLRELTAARQSEPLDPPTPSRRRRSSAVRAALAAEGF